MTVTQRQALTNAAALVRRAQSITAFVCSELTRDGQQEQATMVADQTVALKRVAEKLVTPTPRTAETPSKRPAPPTPVTTTPEEQSRLDEQAKTFPVKRLPYMGERPELKWKHSDAVTPD